MNHRLLLLLKREQGPQLYARPGGRARAPARTRGARLRIVKPVYLTVITYTTGRLHPPITSSYRSLWLPVAPCGSMCLPDVYPGPLCVDQHTQAEIERWTQRGGHKRRAASPLSCRFDASQGLRARASHRLGAICKCNRQQIRLNFDNLIQF